MTEATTLVPRGANTPAQLDTEQVALIKRTIAEGATDDELQLFVTQCNRTGLDPFSHQIWFTKRSGKMTIQTGIDGYRLIGERTGRRAGSETFWCGDDGVWKDVWLDAKNPSAAKTVVKKIITDGTIATEVGIALWAEYGINADGFMWKKMPAGQLGKCSEALALRKAFPAELSSLYTDAEMDQAGIEDGSTAAASSGQSQPSTSSGRRRSTRSTRPAAIEATATDAAGPVEGKQINKIKLALNRHHDIRNEADGVVVVGDKVGREIKAYSDLTWGEAEKAILALAQPATEAAAETKDAA